MRSAAQVFYLAVFALLTPSHASGNAATRSTPTSPEVCAIDSKAIVSDACASYSTLDALNKILGPSLKTITQTTDFFAYYRLNLFNQVCPFWDDPNSMCGNIACVVNTLDNEEDIPPIWRAHELSKLEGPKAAHPGRQLQQERGKERPLQGTLGESVGESCVVEYDDECDERDYCVPEDESASAKGDYVSLMDNPERFTGYAGEGAHMVWDAIYRENCFPRAASPSSGASKLQAANDLRSVMLSGASESEIALDDECLEKRVFHRIISGMHASISTHICHDYLNQTTGTWGPNLHCYSERLAAHPDRISNLYFNYALVLRAVAKLRTYLKNYTFCTGDPLQDLATKRKVLALTDRAASGGLIFDETLMFTDPAVGDLKEDFRNRFRNVSRLMDCVGCDKCRLWGKLQTVGYGTALKVLFEYDENKNGENPPLRRTELVALVNTLDRISNSLTALEGFRGMVAAKAGGGSSAGHTASRPNGRDEQAVKPNPSPHPLSKPAIPRAEPSFSPPSSLSSPSSTICSSSEDEAEADLHNITHPPLTVMDNIRDECNLVWRTFGLVLRSWTQLPEKVMTVFLSEMDRLWAFWLGLPVQPRSWEFRRPGREEL
ncbi:Endoplasmic reticulum oxidoreductin 1 [Lasallia pustulata]|uniref:Endoplasmic reticulum oxidoreductin 1 n=1 Tax=Lasallia pustulata TaxID=136370 RepID=A0A1W5D833_9LECA|nr:Endoplasmic reticulum oxidoreductin 1 [Lasallia pustulata]